MISGEWDKRLGMAFAAFIFVFLFSHGVCPEPISSDDVDRIDRLGQEFQRQAPWFRPPERGGGFVEGSPQPPSYLSSGQTELPREEGNLPPPWWYGWSTPIYWPIFYDPWGDPSFPRWWRPPWRPPSDRH